MCSSLSDIISGGNPMLLSQLYVPPIPASDAVTFIPVFEHVISVTFPISLLVITAVGFASTDTVTWSEAEQPFPESVAVNVYVLEPNGALHVGVREEVLLRPVEGDHAVVIFPPD